MSLKSEVYNQEQFRIQERVITSTSYNSTFTVHYFVINIFFHYLEIAIAIKKSLIFPTNSWMKWLVLYSNQGRHGSQGCQGLVHAKFLGKWLREFTLKLFWSDKISIRFPRLALTSLLGQDYCKVCWLWENLRFL